MEINYSLDIGTIIQIALILFGGFGAFIRLEAKIKQLSTDLADVSADVDKVSDKVSGLGINLATHEIRIAHLETELRFMKGNAANAA